MMPHGVPSAGDWALDRYAAIYLQGTSSPFAFCLVVPGLPMCYPEHDRVGDRSLFRTRQIKPCNIDGERDGAVGLSREYNVFVLAWEVLSYQDDHTLLLTLAGTEGALIDGCTLERIDGNGVIVSGPFSPRP